MMKKETEMSAEKVVKEPKPKLMNIKLEKLHPFESHPYKVLDDESMTELVESIKECGLLNRIIVRPLEDKAIFDDGIFQVGKDKYSKSYKFTDINYAVASREDKEAMFLEYSELLNSLDSGATTKITINNRRLNRLDFEKTILIGS